MCLNVTYLLLVLTKESEWILIKTAKITKRVWKTKKSERQESYEGIQCEEVEESRKLKSQER
jgi:hypothetical protein